MECNTRICFVQPRLDAHDFFSVNGKEQFWIPWGLVYLRSIAASLGYSTTLVDRRLEPNLGAIFDSLHEGDILAVSVMTGFGVRDAVEISKSARTKGIWVLWGGPHVSLYPSETLQFCPCDAVIPGMGFGSFKFFLQKFSESGWPTVNGEGYLVHFGRGAQAEVPIEVHLEVVSGIGSLELEDINWHRYTNADSSIAPRTINFNTSEGCNCSCTFCSEPTLSSRRRLDYPVHNCIRWIHQCLDHSGANGVKLFDPNFFANYQRALCILGAFEDKSIAWAASMHPRTLQDLSEKEVGRLSRLGVRRLLVGLESPNEDVIKLCKKGYSPEKIPEMVRKLTSVGICGMFTFIVGWPGVSPNHIEETIRCAKSIKETWGEHQAKIHFLEYWPGTPIYNSLQKLPSASRYPDDWYQMNYYSSASNVSLRDQEMVRKANIEICPYVDA